MKNKVISVAVILLLVIAVVISVKSGRLNIIDNKPEDNVQNSYAENEIKSSTNTEEQSNNYESESYSQKELDRTNGMVIDVTDADGNVVEQKVITKENMNNMVLLNIGEENLYENTGLEEKKSLINARYNIKYIDCEVSNSKLDETELDYYPVESQKYCNESGEFEPNTYYYMAITYEVTNIGEKDWDNNGFSTQNLSLGKYYESGFDYQTEPVGRRVINGTSINGIVYVDRNATATITNYYIVAKEFLEQDNIAARVDIFGDGKATSIPYFIIDKDNIIKR